MKPIAIALALASLVACSKNTPERTTTAAASPVVATDATNRASSPTRQAEEGGDETNTIVVEPMRIEVIRDAEGNEQVIARDARGIFDEANDALALGEFERAIGLYDEILRDFAESSLSAPALYNAGLALEALERIDDAVERYRELAQRPASGEEGIDARIRMAALLAEHERWSDALDALDGMLALTGLSPSNRLEAMARRGYVLLEAKDYAAAEKQLGECIAYYESKQGRRQVFDDDYFLAMAYFYLGDIPRRQFDGIPIRLPESQMERDMEAKAVLLTLADERFDAVLELRHPYWSTAAGFRKADMQREFWVALVRAPVPPHLDKQAAKLYVEEVHKLALTFLEKALDLHSKSVQLATLYKVPTQWTEASSAEVVRLTELIGREKAGDLGGMSELGAGQGATRVTSSDYIPSRIDL